MQRKQQKNTKKTGPDTKLPEAEEDSLAVKAHRKKILTKNELVKQEQPCPQLTQLTSWHLARYHARTEIRCKAYAFVVRCWLRAKNE